MGIQHESRGSRTVRARQALQSVGSSVSPQDDRSPATLRQYGVALGHFLRWAGTLRPGVDCADLDLALAEAFVRLCGDEHPVYCIRTARSSSWLASRKFKILRPALCYYRRGT